jgi:hypothetical protein
VVLRLAGSRLPQGDVRDIILIGRELIVGPTTAAHVRTAAARRALRLVMRDGRLTCEDAAQTSTGETIAAGTPLPHDQPLQIGTLTLTLGRS